MERKLFTVLLLASMLVACGNGLPSRGSPTPAVTSGTIDALAVVDVVAPEPTWYDAATERVVRRRGGVIAPVQDVAVVAPAAFRVLSDDTIVALVEPAPSSAEASL